MDDFQEDPNPDVNILFYFYATVNWIVNPDILILIYIYIYKKRFQILLSNQLIKTMVP